MGQRQKQDEYAREQAEGRAKSKRELATDLARGLATHRHEMERERARQTGGKRIPITPEILAYAKEHKIAIPPGTTDVPEGVLYRDMPTAELGLRYKLAPETVADVDEVVKGIARGDAPPDLGEYGRDSVIRIHMTAKLMRMGYNLKTQQQKFLAEKVFLRSANGTIAVRGMRNVVNARESLDYTQQLLDQSNGVIPRGRFTMFNKIEMTKAAEGLYGPEAAALARQLRAQVAAVRFELSNIYMGGTAPTDQAIKKAMDVIDSDWSEDGLRGAIALARRDLGIRVNAIREVGPITLEDGEVKGAPKLPGNNAEKDSGTINFWLRGLSK